MVKGARDFSAAEHPVEAEPPVEAPKSGVEEETVPPPPQAQDTFQPSADVIGKVTRARKRGAAMRLGEAVRSQIVMPSEIAKYLKEKTPDFLDKEGKPVDFDALGKGLAREILETATSGQAAPHKLYAKGQSYEFPIFNSNNERVGTQSVTLPVDLWVERLAHGIELELVGRKLGEGSYKQVFQSKTLQLAHSKDHAKTLDHTVLVSAKDEAGWASLMQGAKLVRERFTPEELKDPNFRLAGLYEKENRVNPEGKRELRELELRGGSLQSKIENEEHLSVPNALRAASDLSYTLQRLHAKGLTHGDVKPENVALDKDGHGWLADIDGIRAEGEYAAIASFPYLDPFNRPVGGNPSHHSPNPVQTSYSDIFATALTVEQALFPFASSLKTLPDYEAANDPDQFWSRATSQISEARLSPEQKAGLELAREAIYKVLLENKTLLGPGFRHLRDLHSEAFRAPNAGRRSRATRELSSKLPGFNNLLKDLGAAKDLYAGDAGNPKMQESKASGLADSDFTFKSVNFENEDLRTQKLKLRLGSDPLADLINYSDSQDPSEYLFRLFNDASHEENPRAKMKEILDSEVFKPATLQTLPEEILYSLESQLEGVKKKYVRPRYNLWRALARQETLETKLERALNSVQDERRRR